MAVVVIALYFDFTNGFHDTANTVATCIATGAMKPKWAIFASAVLNFCGALLAVEVAKTIAGGIVQAGGVTASVVLCALLSAIVWNLMTWWWGQPSSSSHALIGGLIGATLGHGGVVLWDGFVGNAVVPMLVSPILGVAGAYLILQLLEHLKISHKPWSADFYRHAQLASAGALSVTHGMNDAQKTMGIITLALYASGGAVGHLTVPLWVKITCATVMGLGTAVGGMRIIRTLGFEITKLRPIDGFAAEAASATVIGLASHWGMPVSTTHTVTSAVVGAGMCQKEGGLHLKVVKNIAKTWIFTFPVTMGLAWGLMKLWEMVFK